MPSVAAHMVVAKLVGEKLNIYNKDFIRGNLLPDIILNSDSHHVIDGKMFKIPDIMFFIEKNDLNNNLSLGYLTHLLLDKYYLDNYLPKKVADFNVFDTKIIYNDYSCINYKLVKEFNLNVEYLKNVLRGYLQGVDKEKLESNLKYLSLMLDGKTIYLNYEDFSNFIYEISQVISEEIKNYAS